MSEKKTNRRDFLFTATYAVGAVGVGATIWPMIDQMNPDASVKALASTEVDVSAVNPGKTITVLWRGKPVFIRRRTQDEIAEARSVKLEDLKHPEKDEDRAANPEWLVMLGVCTHLGCVPLDQKGEYNGWFCPCHGSHMISLEELERDQLRLIWRSLNMNLLMLIQLKLDNYYE